MSDSIDPGFERALASGGRVIDASLEARLGADGESCERFYRGLNVALALGPPPRSVRRSRAWVRPALSLVLVLFAAAGVRALLGGASSGGDALRPIAPTGAQVRPPEFFEWKRAPGAESYVVELTSPHGRVSRLEAGSSPRLRLDPARRPQSGEGRWSWRAVARTEEGETSGPAASFWIGSPGP